MPAKEIRIKTRKYFRVNKKGIVVGGPYNLNPEQVKGLNAQLINGERMFRHPPVRKEPLT